MINYDEVAPSIKSRYGSSFDDNLTSPSKIVSAFNRATEYIAETVLRDNFIFEYTFTTDGSNTEYVMPTIYSVLEFFSGDTRLVKYKDWVFFNDRLLYPDCISIGMETIVFPEATSSSYTLQYRGTPTKVNLENDATKQVNLSSSYEKAIIPLASYFLFQDEKQFDNAVAQFNDYRLMITACKGAFLDRDEKIFERVSGNHKF